MLGEGRVGEGVGESYIMFCLVMLCGWERSFSRKMCIIGCLLRKRKSLFKLFVSYKNV